MTFITPADTLSALELLAIGEEKEHRYGTQTQRTVEHVMERLTLYVVATYGDGIESRIVLWSTATLEKAMGDARPAVYLFHYCDWQGHRVSLARDAAVQVLATGDIPEAVKTQLQVQASVIAAQVALDRDDAALFDSLNRGTSSPYVDRPPLTPRRRSTTRLLPALPHAEAVERMRRFYE